MCEVVLTALDEDLATAWERFCGDVEGFEIHRGSVLEAGCDAVVSPANSFGFMDGGIDAVYRKHFGYAIQESVQRMIAERHRGEILVGAAELVKTGDAAIPHLIVAPTMRVPMILKDSVNVYLAARAVLHLVKGAPQIRRVGFPGLGTGVGQVSANVCARQVRAAIDDVWLGGYVKPATWAEASERHQLLYTDYPRRLNWTE